MLFLSLWFPLAPLAEATSTITLAVFTLVNLALWRTKKDARSPPPVWQVPAWVPLAGFVTSLGFVIYGLVLLAG